MCSGWAPISISCCVFLQFCCPWFVLSLELGASLSWEWPCAGAWGYPAPGCWLCPQQSAQGKRHALACHAPFGPMGKLLQHECWYVCINYAGKIFEKLIIWLGADSDCDAVTTQLCDILKDSGHTHLTLHCTASVRYYPHMWSYFMENVVFCVHRLWACSVSKLPWQTRSLPHPQYSRSRRQSSLTASPHSLTLSPLR